LRHWRFTAFAVRSGPSPSARICFSRCLPKPACIVSLAQLKSQVVLADHITLGVKNAGVHLFLLEVVGFDEEQHCQPLDRAVRPHSRSVEICSDPSSADGPTPNLQWRASS
jgi:hypothetical protein